MDKKVNLIYFSATGTTEQTIKAIGKGVSNKLKDFNITLPMNRKQDYTFDENDLLIVGVPVYGGRVPEFLLDYFSKIKGNNTLAVFVVVYGNRDYDDALLELKEVFEKNAFIGIAAGAFIGEHSYTDKVATGRPDKEDLKKAYNFGLSIKEKINKISNTKEMPSLLVKGNHPYKERSAKTIAAPITDETCIKCGICATTCPMAAISFTDYSKIDSSLCIHCCSCIKICPVNAKSFNDETIENIVEKLNTQFRLIRQEPELF